MPSVNSSVRRTKINLKSNTSNVKLNILFTPRPEISCRKLCIAKDDSTASHHYWRTEDKDCLADMHIFKGPPVLLPNIEK